MLYFTVFMPLWCCKSVLSNIPFCGPDKGPLKFRVIGAALHASSTTVLLWDVTDETAIRDGQVYIWLLISKLTELNL